jgi:hypothetical protein
MKSRWNFSQRTHPIHPIKLMFWGVLDFTSSCNEVALEFFATNELDLPHWTLNSCFRVFWTVSLLHELRCKTGRTGSSNAQVRATKSRRNFSQQTHPIHPIGLKLKFYGVSNRFIKAPTSVQNRPNWCD